MAENFIRFRAEGYKELQDRIAQFPARFRRNAMRGGMRAALTILKKGADKRLAQRTKTRTGQLRRTLRTSTQSFNDGARLQGRVSVGGVNRARKGKAWYAHIIERGSKPHIIDPRNGGALLIGGRFAKSVKHPGTAATWFMRDTAQQDGPKAEKAFAAYVEKRVATYLDPK